MFFGPYLQYWWLAIPGVLLGLYAQMRLSSNYSKYSEIQSERGLTGAGAARAILDDAGLPGMEIEMIPGHLTDHYDPIKKALFLSEESYSGTSLAAVGVAAHEAGHALQQQAAYAFLNFRMWLIPATQFATNAVGFIFLLGFFLNIVRVVAPIAIAIYAVIALFQIITLPVEFDASRRAKAKLLSLGLINQDEHYGVNKMLGAAAMTYVAAMITAVLMLLQWIMIARNDDDRR